MKKLDAVRDVIFFDGLPDDILERLADIAVMKRYAKGETLFLADAEADGFYAPVSGRVKVFRTSPAGKEQILHIFGAGEAVGEVPVFEGGTFPAQCEAVEDCDALFFPRRDFRRILQEDPDLAMKMMAMLSQRMRSLVHKIDDLSLKETPARVAAHLLLLRSSTDSDTFRLDLPKGQIALYLGTIQETLSRILKRFSEDGLIDMSGREITVLDRDGLRDIAESGK
ncbi:Crp/Fnr family transcriptional regulator [Pseudodesulfovibrio indicus]|uniref:Crp/Fnr family transcriptional regulator n=1 Tax=Pseudodesulfovibrio indicus TaxID=1716143 RepID=UPI00292D7ACF|nr:Crp/Fnr family transcriptional regulator [Pseudodesulfovibrio indicus]